MNPSKPLLPWRGGLVLAVAGAALLAGCASGDLAKERAMTPEQHRQMYPRKYVEGQGAMDHKVEQIREVPVFEPPPVK